MKRNRAAAGLAGCGLLALGIVLSFIMFLRQRESVSVASMEPVASPTAVICTSIGGSSWL